MNRYIAVRSWLKLRSYLNHSVKFFFFFFVFSYDSTESLDEAMRLFFDLKRVKGASPFISMKSLWLYNFKYKSPLTDLPN